jgi:Arc/MetJ-type ribon-helix-helix transcriptional regulator
MTSQRPGYQAYLLRLWQERNGEETHWRASLQDAHSGERRAFGDLEALFEFLRARTEVVSDLTAEEKG